MLRSLFMTPEHIRRGTDWTWRDRLTCGDPGVEPGGRVPRFFSCVGTGGLPPCPSIAAFSAEIVVGEVVVLRGLALDDRLDAVEDHPFRPGITGRDRQPEGEAGDHEAHVFLEGKLDWCALVMGKNPRDQTVFAERECRVVREIRLEERAQSPGVETRFSHR